MAKMSASDVKMIAISSAVAAAASVIASAIVAALIARASERRAQASAEQSVWTILGEQQQQPVSGYGAKVGNGCQLGLPRVVWRLAPRASRRMRLGGSRNEKRCFCKGNGEERKSGGREKLNGPG